jgi:hypothetical protein
MKQTSFSRHASRLWQLVTVLIWPTKPLQVAFFLLPLLGVLGLGLGIAFKQVAIVLFSPMLLACWLGLPLYLPLILQRQLANRSLLLLPNYAFYLWLLAQSGPLLACILTALAVFWLEPMQQHWALLVYVWLLFAGYNWLILKSKLWVMLCVITLLIVSSSLTWVQSMLQQHWQQPWLLTMAAWLGLMLSWQLRQLPLTLQDDRWSGRRLVSQWWQYCQSNILTSSQLTHAMLLQRSDSFISLNSQLWIWALLHLALFAPAYVDDQLNVVKHQPEFIRFLYVIIGFSTLLTLLTGAGKRLGTLWWYGQSNRAELLTHYETLALRCLLLMLPALVLLALFASRDLAYAAQLLSFAIPLTLMLFYLNSCLLGKAQWLSVLVLSLALASMLFTAWTLRAQWQFYLLPLSLALFCLPLRQIAKTNISQLDFATLLQQQQQQREQQYAFFKSGR